MRNRLTVLWRHSTLVASLSAALAKRAGLDPEIARLAGLIHDIGALPVLVWAERVPHLLEDGRRLSLVTQRLHADGCPDRFHDHALRPGGSR